MKIIQGLTSYSEGVRREGVDIGCITIFRNDVISADAQITEGIDCNQQWVSRRLQ